MLYLITNRNLVNKNFYRVIEEGVAGGVDRIILREKDLPDHELKAMAMKINVLLDGTECQLIINGNLQVANEVGAWGYHVGQNRLEGLQKPYPVLGVSAHSLTEAQNGINYQCDYLLVSHIYPTACKAGLAPKGIQLLDEVVKNTTAPVIALGGIDVSKIPEVMEHGASGVAVMSAIMASSDPYMAAKKLKEAIIDTKKRVGVDKVDVN